MRSKTKLILIISAVVVIATAIVIAVILSRGYYAKTMRLLRIEGTVTLEDENGNSQPLTENMRFQSGQAISTAAASLASIGLDEHKIVTLQENSRAEFHKAGNQMELNLTAGGVFFEVDRPLESDETFDIRTSTMIVGIRGTSGYVFVDDDGRECVLITDGHVHIIGTNPVTGEVKETDLWAGNQAKVYLYNDRTVDSIEFELNEVDEEDLTRLTLQMLVEDPDLLDRVCEDTGWDADLIRSLLEGNYIATGTPADTPTDTPADTPTDSPTRRPTRTPSDSPTDTPQATPSGSPPRVPSITPAVSPTTADTVTDTPSPSVTPTPAPTFNPTEKPTSTPTAAPTAAPTDTPTTTPVLIPTSRPTSTPTTTPTGTPTSVPTITPVTTPTTAPTQTPTVIPTDTPTEAPTETPTDSPTPPPTETPTDTPVPYVDEYIEEPEFRDGELRESLSSDEYYFMCNDEVGRDITFVLEKITDAEGNECYYVVAKYIGEPEVDDYTCRYYYCDGIQMFRVPYDLWPG